jgi:CO/xanthine dehydrogenase Mo-binding subunit
MGEYSVIGKSLPRVDAWEKVTGQTKFSGDIMAPGMLYGKIKRSPHPHAIILNIDISKAKSLKGVREVITANDIPNRIRLGMSVLDQPILAENKVRYIGDAICAVAAIDEDIAEEALDLIKVDFELLPAVFDSEEAMKEGAPKVHEAERNIAGIRRVVKGNIEEGLKEADYVFEDRFTTQGVDQVPLETDTAVAMFDSNGHLKMWFATHSPFVQVPIVAKMLGISEDKITIIVSSLGGSFGGKGQVLIGYVCAALARICGVNRPLKMTHTREEEFMCSTIRHPSVVYLKTGLRKDGRITGRQAKYILNTGAYTNTGDLVVQWAGMCFSGVYKTPHLSFNGYCVYTNCANAGSFRGFGNPQLTFAVESQMDMIAERLGIDPVDLRLMNTMEKGDKMATGWQLRSCGLKECIKEAAKAIRWSTWVRQKTRGLGIACGNHGSGWRIDQKTAGASYNTDASTCILRVNPGEASTSISERQRKAKERRRFCLKLLPKN